MNNFEETLYQIDQTNNEEKLMDFIFEWFDDRYNDFDLKSINDVFSKIEVEKLSILALIAISSVTLIHKEQMEDRTTYMQKVRDKIKRERPLELEGLLSGLE